MYYRIKQIDKNGAFDYSAIRAVSFTTLDQILVNYVGPNPFKTDLHFDFDLPSADKVTVSLFDITGQEVKTAVYEGLKGNNAHTIKVADLSNGVYFFKIVSGTNTYSEKVIKQD